MGCSAKESKRKKKKETVERRPVFQAEAGDVRDGTTTGGVAWWCEIMHNVVLVRVIRFDFD